jgi:hypothetical protein
VTVAHSGNRLSLTPCGHRVMIAALFIVATAQHANAGTVGATNREHAGSSQG